MTTKPISGALPHQNWWSKLRWGWVTHLQPPQAQDWAPPPTPIRSERRARQTGSEAKPDLAAGPAGGCGNATGRARRRPDVTRRRAWVGAMWAGHFARAIVATSAPAPWPPARELRQGALPSAGFITFRRQPQTLFFRHAVVGTMPQRRLATLRVTQVSYPFTAWTRLRCWARASEP